MKTKRLFSELVLTQLQRNFRNSDFKIREQEVWLRMDQLVNELAKKSYFDNWTFTGGTVDEQYVTTWAEDNGIDVVDQDNDKPSYIILPANYADLPRNGGIEEIWPNTYEKSLFHSVIIMSHREVRQYATNKAGNMQGRLFGYLEGGNKFVFAQSHVADEYSEKMNVRLVIRDSTAIALDAPYPVPSDKEKYLIDECVKFFMLKQNQPLEVIRDGNNQPVEP